MPGRWLSASPARASGDSSPSATAPVQQCGIPDERGREHDAHALSRQVDRCAYLRDCAYPFSAPAVRPRTKYRCRVKNTIIGIIIEMNAPAGSSSVP